MARPRQVSNEEILEVARETFIEQGAGVSTTTIAERAGVSQAVLFQRFGTKEKLLFAALSPPTRLPWFDKAEAGPDDRDITEQLRELGGEILSYFRKLFPAMMVLHTAGISPHDLLKSCETPPPIRGFHIMRSWFETALEAGRIEAVDPGVAAMVFAGSIQARVFLTDLTGEKLTDKDDPQYLDDFIELFWKGLAPKEER